MFFAVKGGPLPSHLSAHSLRKGDHASALLPLAEAERPSSPAAWALRTGRRLKVLCLTVLIAIYLIYCLDLLPQSHDPAVVPGPNSENISNPPVVEDSTLVIPDSTVEIESAAAVDSEKDAVNDQAAIDQAAAEQAASEQAAAEQAAAEKAAAEQAAAEKAAAEQAAAEQAAIDKEAFITDLSTDIRGVYDGQSLYNLCSSKYIKWNPDVVFECPPLEGGYGNVRNAALTCLRLAIEFGGSLVMPQISRRNPKDIGDFRTKHMMPFDYLFDAAHFKSTLATYCPQLTIHDTLAALEKHPGISAKALTLTPYDLPNITHNGPVISNLPKIRKSFHAWLKNENSEHHTPIRVSLTSRIIWTWPTSYDRNSLVRSFSGVVRLSRQVRLPAAEALYSLASEHFPPLSSSGASKSKSKSKSKTDFTLPFVGIHLRAEKDAQQYHLTNYTLQTNYYLSRLKTDLLPSLFPASASGDDDNNHKTNTIPIYIASGDSAQIERFAKQLSFVHPAIKVVTKASLLPESALSALTWDQQALVDFQVMERAAYVMGVRESSFAWTLALKRAAAANWVVGGFPSGPCWVDDEEEGEVGDGREGQGVGKRDEDNDTDKGGENAEQHGEEANGQQQEGVGKADDKPEETTAKAKKPSRRRRGCKEDLAPYEYWRDELSALVGDLGEAANESVDVVRSSIWP